MAKERNTEERMKEGKKTFPVEFHLAFCNAYFEKGNPSASNVQNQVISYDIGHS
jgi:hypothetical protein